MANVSAGYNWVSGETVTPAKLNSAAAPTVVVADNEVTTAKILDATSTTTGVTNSKLRHSAALSVIGRSADSAGAPADIAAANDGEVFRRSGTAVGFGTVVTAGIANAAVTPAKLSQPLTLATAKAFNWNGSSSNTVLDFESIPSWARRITVMFDGVSLSGSSSFLIQLGDSGGFETTNYSGGGARYGVGAISAVSYTTGLGANNTTASATYSGHIVWTNLTGNTWAGSLTLGASGGTESGCIGGSSKTLSATLDRVRITTVSGDTFDAGSVNIMYEG
jgi:hypothetical protein